MTNARHLDFLVIGALKAGTTSLFHYLRHHPRIYVPPEKEIPFFSNEQRFARGWEEFFNEFLAKAPSSSLLGKVTPQYMEKPRPFVPERIFQMMSHIKLIAMLRNPVERAFSHYRMELRFQREDRSFEEAFASHRNGTKTKSYFTAGLYGELLNQYLKYFRPEQLLVQFTEDLERAPETVLDSILSYLGLGTGYRPQNLDERYHVGGRQRFPNLTPLVKKIRPLKWLYRTLPVSKRRVIWGWFTNEGNVVREATPALHPEARQQLIDFYLPDIELLESIIRQRVPWKEFHR